MSEKALYRQVCPTCDGVGLAGEPLVSCPRCGGGGVLKPVIYATGIDTILGQVFDDNLVATYQIIESTKASEYNALSDNNKDAYRMIVSCGVVDLTDGTAIRTKLWNMFDSESETRAALITLLGE